MFEEKLRLVGERLSDIFSTLVAFFPALLIATVVFVAGWFLARVLRFLVIRVPWPFGLSGKEELPAGGPAHLTRAPSAREKVGHFVYWILFLLTVVLCFEVLGLPVGAGIVQELLGLVPRLFVAVLIFFFGFLVAVGVEGFARSFLQRMRSARSGSLARALRWVTLAFVLLLAVEQLGLAAQFALWIILILVGAGTFAVALAFGLGCKEMARDLVIEFFRKEETGGASQK